MLENVGNKIGHCPSQVSDDEDDTHPNIDTPSLFKWRHEARVQRTQEFEDKKKTTEQELSKYVPYWLYLKLNMRVMYPIISCIIS